MSATSPEPSVVLPPSAVEALLLDTTPWLSCEECFERMDGYVESLVRDSTPQDRAMHRHLLGCAACDEEVRSLLALVEGSPTVE
jgi:hypothetical protein